MLGFQELECLLVGRDREIGALLLEMEVSETEDDLEIFEILGPEL